MRRVNWTFAAGLLLVFAAVAGAFHALHVVRYGTIADELGRQVTVCRDEGRTDDAIKFAAQYLEFRPGDAGMIADLAGWLQDKAKTPKQRASVLGLWERILRLTPDDRAARRKAAELNMTLGGCSNPAGPSTRKTRASSATSRSSCFSMATPARRSRCSARRRPPTRKTWMCSRC